MTLMSISSILPADLSAALRRGDLALHLGPFVVALKSPRREVVDHLLDQYRDCLVTLDGTALADYSLTVDAPNMLRRFIRPHIVPNPGFHFPAAPLPPKMAALAVEMGMNLCVALQCFRFAIFHAGVVADGADAVVIAAQSGGGKSTLTAALMQSGYRLLSDEFALLGLKGEGVVPYPRPVSLKNESIDVVQGFAGADAVSRRLQETPKGQIAYRRPRLEDIQHQHVAARPKLLIFPEFGIDEPPRTENVETAEAAMLLIASSPNYQVIGEPAFDALTQMLGHTACFKISYGTTEDSVAIVRELMEEARAI